MSVPPLKANAPLVVDADTVLPHPVSSQFLQSGSRQSPKRAHIRRRIKQVQLPERLALNGPKPRHGVSQEEPFGFSAAEGPDHSPKVYCCALNVNEYIGGRRWDASILPVRCRKMRGGAAASQERDGRAACSREL